MPLGVVAIIYESRPNVTSDAAGLALKSGNTFARLPLYKLLAGGMARRNSTPSAHSTRTLRTPPSDRREATMFAAVRAAYELTRTEGIIPALESAHALGVLPKMKFKPEDVVVLTVSGRVVQRPFRQICLPDGSGSSGC